MSLHAQPSTLCSPQIRNTLNANARDQALPFAKAMVDIRENSRATRSNAAARLLGETARILQATSTMLARAARVLIVDDSEEATELLALLIGRRGHEVRVAHDVDGALRVANEFKPNVALLDIMIRHESGFFLARNLRDIPDLKSCRLIAMSGFGLERHRKLSEAVGFRRQLSKPIDPNTLFEAIEAQDN